MRFQHVWNNYPQLFGYVCAATSRKSIECGFDMDWATQTDDQPQPWINPLLTSHIRIMGYPNVLSTIFGMDKVMH